MGKNDWRCPHCNAELAMEVGAQLARVNEVERERDKAMEFAERLRAELRDWKKLANGRSAEIVRLQEKLTEQFAEGLAAEIMKGKKD